MITTENAANAWISPWPSYNAAVQSCSRDANILNCQSGITVNLETMDATLPNQEGPVNPRVFTYTTKEGTIKKEYPDSPVPFGLTLIPQGSGYGVLYASHELSAGMFTRMYYHEGHGLRYFEPFNVARDSSGLLIYTYKVNWDGTNVTQVYDDIELESIEIVEDDIIEDENIEIEKESAITNETNENTTE